MISKQFLKVVAIAAYFSVAPSNLKVLFLSVDVSNDQSRNNHPYAKSINYVCGDVNSFRTPLLTCVAREKY